MSIKDEKLEEEKILHSHFPTGVIVLKDKTGFLSSSPKPTIAYIRRLHTEPVIRRITIENFDTLKAVGVRSEKLTVARFIDGLTTDAITELHSLPKFSDTSISFPHVSYIGETLVDIYFIGRLYGLTRKEICDSLVPILLSNESVYGLDDIYDNQTQNGENISLAEALGKRSENYALLNLLLHYKGRSDIWSLLGQMFLSVEALFCTERFRELDSPQTKVMLDHVGECYNFFFQPTDKVYLDTGSHMTMFLELVKNSVPNRPEFEQDLDVLKKYSNTSRRITDIGDALIDFEKDLDNGILSPFGAYTFYMSTEEERETLLKALSIPASYRKSAQKIMRAYAQRVALANRGYMSDIAPTSEKSSTVKSRFLKVSDYVLQMTEDIRARKKYHDFYAQTLSNEVLS